MRKIYLYLLFILYAYGSYSQGNIDSLKSKYNNQTIYRSGNFFMKGNERLVFRDLEHEFDNSDLGKIEYQKAKTYNTIGRIFGVAALLTSIAIYSFATQGNNNAAYISIGAQFAFLIVSGNYHRMSAQNLDRAIWQRNKDLLFK